MEFHALEVGRSLVLPPKRIKRWVARHKASVLAAVEQGMLTRMEACARYNISDEEFAAWTAAFARHGLSGLKAHTLARAGQEKSRRCEEHRHAGLD